MGKQTPPKSLSSERNVFRGTERTSPASPELRKGRQGKGDDDGSESSSAGGGGALCLETPAGGRVDAREQRVREREKASGKELKPAER